MGLCDTLSTWLFPARDGEKNIPEFSLETRDDSPSNLLLKIEPFSLLSTYGISKYESREFEAGDYKWKLIIYPDGKEGESRGHLCVYLSLAKTTSLPHDWEINAIFSFFLYNHNSDNYLSFRGKLRRFNAVNTQYGLNKLISTTSLIDPKKGFVVDDCCVFGAEVFVLKNQRISECLSLLRNNSTHKYKREWMVSSFSKLGQIWNSEEFSLGSHNWKVMVYPNGDGSAKGRFVSIFVECISSKSFAPHQKLNARVCISFKNQLHTTQHVTGTFNHWFAASEPNRGYAELIGIEAIKNGYLVKDCCMLEVEISLQAFVLDAPNSTTTN